MSFDIGSIGQAQLDTIQSALMSSASSAASVRGAAPAGAYQSASAAAASGAASDASTDFAVQVQLASSAEDLGTQLGDAIPRAAQAYGDLAATGHHIHFSLSDQPGSLLIELQNQDGAAVGRLYPSGVLAVASGETVT